MELMKQTYYYHEGQNKRKKERKKESNEDKWSKERAKTFVRKSVSEEHQSRDSPVSLTSTSENLSASKQRFRDVCRARRVEAMDEAENRYLSMK